MDDHLLLPHGPPKHRNAVRSKVVHTFDKLSCHSQRKNDIRSNPITMIILSFMLRPGEYYGGGSDVKKSPCRLKAIQFSTIHRDIPAVKFTDSLYSQVTPVSLTFADEKNCDKGEIITY